MKLSRRALIIALSVLAACGGGETLNINAVPLSTRAGCTDAPTPELLMTTVEGTMLPGWNCLQCHAPGGQASNFPHQAAGTVYGAMMTTTCDTGGVPGVLVEILDASLKVQAMATTNSSGNFFINSQLTYPLTARISKNGMMQQMGTPQMTGACASCHQVPGLNAAPGRLSLIYQ